METVETILSAAAGEFAEKGFGGARMDSIAEKADVNKASIYYHIGNKEELYAAVFEAKMKKIKGKLKNIKHQDLSPDEKLEEVIYTISSVPRKHPELPRIMMREIANYMENLPGKTKKLFSEFTGIIKDILEEGQRKEYFREMSPILTLVTIMGGNCFTVVGGKQIQEVINEGTGEQILNRDEMREHLVEMFLSGIING